MDVNSREVSSVFHIKANQCCGEAAVLCDDGAECHACNVLFHHHDEENAENDIEHVDYYGDSHRDFRVLHPDEPAVEAVEKHVRRCCPDSNIEIGDC